MKRKRNGDFVNAQRVRYFFIVSLSFQIFLYIALYFMSLSCLHVFVNYFFSWQRIENRKRVIEIVRKKCEICWTSDFLFLVHTWLTFDVWVRRLDSVAKPLPHILQWNGRFFALSTCASWFLRCCWRFDSWMKARPHSGRWHLYGRSPGTIKINARLKKKKGSMMGTGKKICWDRWTIIDLSFRSKSLVEIFIL